MGFLDHKAIGMVEAEEPLELCTACTTIMAKRKGDTFSRVDEIMKKHRADKGRVDEINGRVDEIMKKYRADKEEEKVEQEKYEKEQEKYEKEDKELQEELDALRRIIEDGKEDDEEEEEKDDDEEEEEKEEKDDEEEKEGEEASTPGTPIQYSPQSPEFL